MKRAAALLCGLIACASARAVPQAPPVGAGVCDAAAKVFSGPVQLTAEGRVHFQSMVEGGNFDIDGDGAPDEVGVGAEGSGGFAFVTVNGERAPYTFRKDRPREADAGRAMTGTHDIRYFPHGNRWYATWFWVGSPAPAGLVAIGKTDQTLVCGFDHKETEAAFAMGPATAKGEPGCLGMPGAKVTAPAADDALSDMDLAALRVAEPMIAREQDTKAGSTLWTGEVYHADFDNDGKTERLLQVFFSSGAGPGCDTEQLRLLPDKGKADIDEARRLALIAAQGLDKPYARSTAWAGCASKFRLRSVQGKTVIEASHGTMSGSYTALRPHGDGLRCSKAINSTVTVSYRGGAQ